MGKLQFLRNISSFQFSICVINFSRLEIVNKKKDNNDLLKKKEVTQNCTRGRSCLKFQICTKTLLHEDKYARWDKIAGG